LLHGKYILCWLWPVTQYIIYTYKYFIKTENLELWILFDSLSPPSAMIAGQLRIHELWMKTEAPYETRTSTIRLPELQSSYITSKNIIQTHRFPPATYCCMVVQHHLINHQLVLKQRILRDQTKQDFLVPACLSHIKQ